MRQKQTEKPTETFWVSFLEWQEGNKYSKQEIPPREEGFSGGKAPGTQELVCADIKKQ